jgi:hypothetical protein
MLVTKNTYGVTSVFKARNFDITKLGEVSGSALDRKPQTEEDFIKRLINKPLFPEPKKEREPRTMSNRTKSKIRRKVLAFARIHKHLSFVTLTFVNQVEEDQAVKVLGKFLENVNKRSKDFQYLWVAEKQLENKVFKDNIHFHLITNKYWKIDRWWKYWLELQAKHGITPREENFKPSSAFDVRAITGQNVKAIANYLTFYITKNEGQFKCQIWNCSKKVSWLNTSMYEDTGFLKRVEALEKANLLGGERKMYQEEYYTVHTIPLNRNTLRLYSKIDEANKAMWHQSSVNEKPCK